MKKFLYWAPRILSISLAVFISIFALDVFDGEYSGWRLALAFIIHLLPTIVTAIFIAIAWKWEKIGGWFFLGLGLAFIYIGGFEPMAIFIVTLPLLITGAMFLLHHYKYIESAKEQTTTV